MVCMEVWGGNAATDKRVETLGLKSWVYNRPFHQDSRGGDVYYLSNCATGRISRMLVADVSGHGSEVGAVAAKLRMLMRKHVNRIEQRDFMMELNREFSNLRHVGGFATAVAGTYFAPTGRLTVTNAGHPPPLIRRASSSTWKSLMDANTPGLSDLPLGILEETDYGERKLNMRAGDLLLFYSDSLIECKNSEGDLLGVNGLLQVLDELGSMSAETLVAQLLKSLAELFPGNLTEDDVTIVLMQSTSHEAGLPFRNRWRAPWLFLKGCLRDVLNGQSLPWPEFTRTNMGGALLDRWNRPGRGHDSQAASPLESSTEKQTGQSR
ncbi:Stage II sporulation protein E (SpoIIE) [Planctomicrobium piriforme]|uniref:Stage II sporulation protein E (SpoIIE) n=2 Tax=Planctomicrobium piriforme TaxID=1576369 RepID=A0A1I3MVL1_9PLAN|nr:Stage II sporulation protein E (SpoIIE) [Planctomicrobium piriforme]